MESQKLWMLLLMELWWVERCPLRKGAAGRTLVIARSPPHGSFHRHHSSFTTSPSTAAELLPRARIVSTTGKMSQPVVQTIHRDPALLYVDGLCEAVRALLTLLQLVDIAPHHSGHGTSVLHWRNCTSL